MGVGGAWVFVVVLFALGGGGGGGGRFKVAIFESSKVVGGHWGAKMFGHFILFFGGVGGEHRTMVSLKYEMSLMARAVASKGGGKL